LARLIEPVKNNTTYLHAANPSAASGRGDFRRSPFTPWALAAWLVFSAGAVATQAGIPEPDLVWYGKVLTTVDNATVRLTSGTLAWRIEPVSGAPAMLFATQLTNLNDQFSFMLRVRCESPEVGQTASTNVINLTSPASRYRRLTVTLDGQPLSLISATNEIAPGLADRGRTERVDLRLGTLPTDVDGDGLADAWELQHFGNLNQNGTGDFDGDGLNNLREYRAGTSPTDPNSVFEVVEISKVPNGVAIQWTSQAERRYRIRRSDSLLTPAANYTVVRSGLTATPPMNVFIDTSAAGSAQFFYLIEIEE
jgi:hypothetical protein